ncbi:MAG: hypothetical protein VX712_10600 [Bacteroidota bacterium]|uniref:Uncharacterized protein n=1 Tax=Christiangramia flava JLT2011 TaxID=1229726 RepID=A0A1L7I7Q3_9FLAO|nr:hypothetical protein [Christiangramia flava]APU69641.1 hypothetical protein GRFL_2917 [Christiangramia flava JLT2011]MEE2772656.1 hypothetical protein [Bacteroidota bacterium]OSS39328.1 hypothetical protein C723_1874 [Christiangramia flava JLT2011]
MSTEVKKHLYYLSELKDYKVNSHDKDITGWPVKDLDNRTIGKVDNLLVNIDLGKVVYVDVEVDHSIISANHDPYAPNHRENLREFINKDGENHIIIPIGLIDIHATDKYVYTETIDYQTFAETKRYRSGTAISREYEEDVLHSYDRRNYSETEDLKRTRTAYENDSIREAELREEQLRRERLQEEQQRLREAEVRRDEFPHSSETVEERMERERANMKYRSDDRKTGINDVDRPVNRDYDPDLTYDESRDWEHDNHDPLEDDPYRKRRRVPREKDDTFYNRREFREKDYR